MRGDITTLVVTSPLRWNGHEFAVNGSFNPNHGSMCDHCAWTVFSFMDFLHRRVTIYFLFLLLFVSIASTPNKEDPTVLLHRSLLSSRSVCLAYLVHCLFFCRRSNCRSFPTNTNVIARRNDEAIQFFEWNDCFTSLCCVRNDGKDENRP